MDNAKGDLCQRVFGIDDRKQLSVLERVLTDIVRAVNAELGI